MTRKTAVTLSALIVVAGCGSGQQVGAGQPDPPTAGATPPAAADAAASNQVADAGAEPDAATSSVACSIPAPTSSVIHRDSLTFSIALKVRRQLRVIGVQGKVLFVGMSPAVHSFGGEREYANQLYELQGTTIRRARNLQRGIWPDFQIARGQGDWPDSAELRGTNYGNSAWETVDFIWNPQLGEWQDGNHAYARFWPGGRLRVMHRTFELEPSPSSLGIPAGLCVDVPPCLESISNLTVVPPRDIYVIDDKAQRLLHWCAPRQRFEATPLPGPVAGKQVVAVPGTLLVSSQKLDFVFRDGRLAPIAFPEPKPPSSKSLKNGTVISSSAWLQADGRFIWYWGMQGLYRLHAGGFERVSAMSRDEATWKLIVPAAPGPAYLTGFLAQSADNLMFTTWNGSETIVWSTNAQTLKL